MSDGVRQEGDELLKVVESLRSEADQFNKTVNDMYTSMKQVIGEEEDANKGWFGPKAAQFIKNVEQKRPEFTTAFNTINAMAQNLEDQVTAWDNFEV